MAERLCQRIKDVRVYFVILFYEMFKMRFKEIFLLKGTRVTVSYEVNCNVKNVILLKSIT